MSPDEKKRVVVWVGKLLDTKRTLYESTLITVTDVLISTATFEWLVLYLQEIETCQPLFRGAVVGRPALVIHGMTLSPCYEVDGDEAFFKLSRK